MISCVVDQARTWEDNVQVRKINSSADFFCEKIGQ